MPKVASPYDVSVTEDSNQIHLQWEGFYLILDREYMRPQEPSLFFHETGGEMGHFGADAFDRLRERLLKEPA